MHTLLVRRLDDEEMSTDVCRETCPGLYQFRQREVAASTDVDHPNAAFCLSYTYR